MCDYFDSNVTDVSGCACCDICAKSCMCSDCKCCTFPMCLKYNMFVICVIYASIKYLKQGYQLSRAIMDTMVTFNCVSCMLIANPYLIVYIGVLWQWFTCLIC